MFTQQQKLELADQGLFADRTNVDEMIKHFLGEMIQELCDMVRLAYRHLM